MSDASIIVVFGNKGGTGKSMLAEHLAVHQAEADSDRAVLLMDLDARQGDSLLFAQGRAQRWPDLPQVQGFAPKDETEMLGALQRMKKLGANVVIDCPPADSPLAMTACAHANAILFPFRSGAHDLRALGRATEMARATYQPGIPPILLAVVNFYRPSLLEARVALDALKERSDVFTFAGVIGERTNFNQALLSHRAVWETAPGSPAAQEIQSVCKNIRTAIKRGSR